MKKIAFILFAFFSTIYAVDDVSKTVADESQKKYERKAILTVDTVGFGSPSFNAPVTFCPYQAKQCAQRGFVSYSVTNTARANASGNFFDLLVTKRFDRIFVGTDSAVIITPKSSTKIDFPGGTFPEFSFSSGTAEDFKMRVDSLLNNKLSGMMDAVLSSAVEKRYKELPETEQGMFIQEKAKELGISSLFIEKLMRSGFVFSVFIPDMSGSVSVSENRITDSKGNTRTTYSATASIVAFPKIIIYRYDPEKRAFTEYNTISLRAAGSSGRSFNSYPGSDNFTGMFDTAVAEFLNKAGEKGNFELKKDDNFAIFSGVEEVDWFKVKSSIGTNEDLRIDAPYYVERKIDDKMKKIGIVKAKKVFDNTENQGQSHFRRIRGSLEQADRLHEHPWWGVFLTLGGSFNNAVVQKNGEYGAGGNFYGFKLGFLFDLGYVFNSRAFTELWMELYFSAGFGGGADLAKTSDLYPEFDVDNSSSLINLVLDFSRRLYPGGGTFIAPKVGFILPTVITASLKDSDLDYSGFTAIGLGVSPGLQFGVLFTPDVELTLTGEWAFRFPVNVKLDGKKKDEKNGIMEDVEDKGLSGYKYKLEGGLGVYLNLSISKFW